MAEPMALYQLAWISGKVAGVLTVWAPDPETALATVQEHPSRFGIPHEHPILGRPKPIPFVEIEFDAA
jgi:hypothetical protein